MNCREATRLISEAMDAPPGARPSWSLRLHLLVCTSCRRFRRHLGFLRTWCERIEARAEAEGADARLTPEARARIAKKLKG